MYCKECLECIYSDNCPLCRTPTVRDGKARMADTNELVDICIAADLDSEAQTPQSDYTEAEHCSFFTICGNCRYAHLIDSRFGDMRRPWFHCTSCATSFCYTCGGFGVGYVKDDEGSELCYSCVIDDDFENVDTLQAPTMLLYRETIAEAQSRGMIYEAIIARSLALIEFVTRDGVGLASPERRRSIRKTLLQDVPRIETIRSTFAIHRLYMRTAFKRTLRMHRIHDAKDPALDAAQKANKMFRYYMDIGARRSVAFAQYALHRLPDGAAFVRKLREIYNTMPEEPMKCMLNLRFNPAGVRLFRSKAEDERHAELIRAKHDLIGDESDGEGPAGDETDGDDMQAHDP